ncbi:MAG: hypothetical protein GY829_06965 [Gammaproteobacteria bacterium]|nr:hypothetical protein [Gammaproteobacteria bacterium]
MQINKSDLITAVFATVIGAAGGLALYWPEIQKNVFPDVASIVWEAGAVDEQVLIDSANFEQMLALNPPRSDAEDSEWKSFVSALDQIEMGKRYSNSGVTTPLLGWYAYIAKHHPASIYNLQENSLTRKSLFNHLIQFGFLEDWADNLKNKDQILLNSNEALLDFSISIGEVEAQRYIANVFLSYADNKSNSDNSYTLKPIDIDLENIIFAMNAMSESEKLKVLPLLQSGLFKFDPRAVGYLIDMKSMDRDGLLSLIKMYAYPSKSMSSYMTTGALLGEKNYVKTMVADVHDNARQPTNFYCSACGLALATEGLIGQALITSAAEQQLKIEQSENGEFILSKKRYERPSSRRLK